MKNLLTLILIIFFFSCNVTEPDTTPPNVTITFPINESTLTEIATIIVNASDNEGVVNVGPVYTNVFAPSYHCKIPVPWVADNCVDVLMQVSVWFTVVISGFSIVI